MSGKQMKRRAFVQAAAGSGLLAAVGTPALAADSTPTPTPDDGDGGSGIGSGFLGDIGAATTDTFVFSPAATVLSWVTGDSNQAEKQQLQREFKHDYLRFKKSISRTLNFQQSTLDYLYDGIFADAKKRAIREINEEETKETVKNEALSRASAEIIKLQQNIIKANNGAIQTIKNYVESGSENGVASDDLLYMPRGDGGGVTSIGFSNSSYSLIDGSAMDYMTYSGEFYVGSTGNYIDFSGALIGGSDGLEINHPDGRLDVGLDGQSLGGKLSSLEDRWNNDLVPDIETWVDNAYDAVASGELVAGDLMTANDLANALSESEPANRALGSLRAAGVDGGEDHPATLSWTLPSDSEVTMTAFDVTLASTGTTASVSTGDTVDPTTVEYDWLTNYRPSDLEVQWPYYQKTVDGGVATINQAPNVNIADWLGQDMTMQIQTVDGETVSIDPFKHTTAKNPSQSFEVDLSEELETAITEIEAVRVYSNTETDPTSTRFLEWPFTVEEIGGDVTSLNFEHDREIHTTDNYLTKEEWEQRKDELEETQDDVSDGPAGGGINLPDVDLGGLPGVGLAGGIVSALLTLVIGGVGLFVMVVLLIVLLGSVSG